MEHWRDAQKRFHQSLSYLPTNLGNVNECPACVIVKAFSHFWNLSNYSEKKPIATVSLNAVDCYPDVVYGGGNTIKSFPCYKTHTMHAEGYSDEVIFREKALLEIDTEKLPVIPPWEMNGLKEDLKNGKTIVRHLSRISDPELHYDEDSEQTSQDDFWKDEIFIAKFPTAITAARAIVDLIHIQHYYPNAIDAKEAKKIQDGLAAHFELVTSDKCFDNLKELYNEVIKKFGSDGNKKFCTWSELNKVKSEDEISQLISLLVLYLPDVQGDKSPDKLAQSIKESLQQCKETAFEPVRQIIAQLQEIMFSNCMVPNPPDDSTFQEPHRFVQLLMIYWRLCESIVVHHIDAPMGYQPHPLLSLIVNLRKRINICIENSTGTVDDINEVQETIDSLLDTVFSGSPDDLSAVPEHTTELIHNIDISLEKTRLQFGAKMYCLTLCEQYFLEYAEKTINQYQKRVKKDWAQVRANAEKKTAQFNKSFNKKQDQPDQTQAKKQDSDKKKEAPPVGKSNELEQALVEKEKEGEGKFYVEFKETKIDYWEWFVKDKPKTKVKKDSIIFKISKVLYFNMEFDWIPHDKFFENIDEYKNWLQYHKCIRKLTHTLGKRLGIQIKYKKEKGIRFQENVFRKAV